MLKSPLRTQGLYFVRSGYIFLPSTNGTLNGSGLGSAWWSTRSYVSASSAYDLVLNTSVAVSHNSSRCDARPLRCLSTVLGM